MCKTEYLDSSLYPYPPKNWPGWKGIKGLGDLSVSVFMIIRRMGSFERVKKTKHVYILLVLVYLFLKLLHKPCVEDSTEHFDLTNRKRFSFLRNKWC